ncbi:hypothetical protein HO133_000018 [Letharia lupina]|uniref:Uncharacterized protein n=1 Tax=Letharia lupina TaxID=560253 RepID=A0A8H6L0A1_9LECA|nr:uncharacterized protein HO133_000018 [Letharia lupina]KAF6230759.1 hypothetical protein HO133_000018 [Letharia lupina]
MDTFSTPKGIDPRLNLLRTPTGSTPVNPSTPNPDNTQSQTVMGESQTRHRLEELENSDEEVLNTTTLSARRKGKRPVSRRYTIEPSLDHTGVQLTDITEEESTAIFVSIANSQDFVESAIDTPDAWCDGLKTLVESFRTASRNIELSNSNGQLSHEREINDRLRGLRDRYRIDTTELTKENEKLKQDLKRKEQQLKEQQPHTLANLENSDEEDVEVTPIPRQPSIPVSSIHRNLRYTPVTDRVEGIELNKRYLDVSDFYGTNNRTKWDSWR